KTIVITGASSGFGRGAATALGAMGAHVVLAARRTAILEELASTIENSGGSALAVTVDVSDPADMSRLTRASIQHLGHIDVWVKNVGTGALGFFLDIPSEAHARVIDVNPKGLIYGAHHAPRHSRAQGFGTLINVGSIDSEVPLAYQAS